MANAQDTNTVDLTDDYDDGNIPQNPTGMGLQPPLAMQVAGLGAFAAPYHAHYGNGLHMHNHLAGLSPTQYLHHQQQQMQRHQQLMIQTAQLLAAHNHAVPPGHLNQIPSQLREMGIALSQNQMEQQGVSSCNDQRTIWGSKTQDILNSRAATSDDYDSISILTALSQNNRQSATSIVPMQPLPMNNNALMPNILPGASVQPLHIPSGLERIDRNLANQDQSDGICFARNMSEQKDLPETTIVNDTDVAVGQSIYDRKGEMSSEGKNVLDGIASVFVAYIQPRPIPSGLERMDHNLVNQDQFSSAGICLTKQLNEQKDLRETTLSEVDDTAAAIVVEKCQPIRDSNEEMSTLDATSSDEDKVIDSVAARTKSKKRQRSIDSDIKKQIEFSNETLFRHWKESVIALNPSESIGCTSTHRNNQLHSDPLDETIIREEISSKRSAYTKQNSSRLLSDDLQIDSAVCDDRAKKKGSIGSLERPMSKKKSESTDAINVEIGNKSFIISNLPPAENSTMKNDPMTTCSFTASNPHLSELGTDFVDTFPEHKDVSAADVNIESSEGFGASNKGAAILSQPLNSLESAKKYPIRLRRSSPRGIENKETSEIQCCILNTEADELSIDDLPLKSLIKEKKHPIRPRRSSSRSVRNKETNQKQDCASNTKADKSSMEKGKGIDLANASSNSNANELSATPEELPVARDDTIEHDNNGEALSSTADYKPQGRKLVSDSSIVLEPSKVQSQASINVFLSDELRVKKKMKKRKKIASPPKKSRTKKEKCVKHSIPPSSHLCTVISQPKERPTFDHPYAPMGSIWLDPLLRDSKSNALNVSAGGTLIGRRWVWDEGYFVDAQFNPSSRPILPFPRCTCGSNHSPEKKIQRMNSSSISESSNGGRSRRSERSGTSSRMTSVLNELASGTLSPHTLISCEEYTYGPEHRFSEALPPEDVQPFSVRVSPDASFLADLHAHMCDSEIIGFLGGHFCHEEKCLYIQAAFPCKSTDRDDSGQTDVEMDPVSQIYAREAIDTFGMSVVGWYHSHPTFQPDPSVTDIENQANYQQLFAESLQPSGSVIPFVGLIVGTYDGRNPTSSSVMRWFHVRNQFTDTYRTVQFPMNLRTTDRQFRKMSDIPSNPRPARESMTASGPKIRRELERAYLSCSLTNSPKAGQSSEMTVDAIGNAATDGGAPDEGYLETGTTSNYDADLNEQRQNQVARSKVSNQGEAAVEAKPDLLLSEEMLRQDAKTEFTEWRFPKARPLYFTDTEKALLESPIESDNKNDVIGGIIWYAIEREQRVVKQSEASSLITAKPPSSGAIFELILRQSLVPFIDTNQKLYSLIHGVEKPTVNPQPVVDVQDNDAIIAHNIDAILSHYSTNPKKVSPFTSWSGALDKGNIVRSEGSPKFNDPNQLRRDFYIANVLGMQRVEVDSSLKYEGGAKKMKRGHKLAACLLKWASDMQLNPRFDFHEEDATLNFDHEQVLQQQSVNSTAHLYFVAEVMRLIAAKWRENSGKSSPFTPPKAREKRSTSKIPSK